MGRLASIAHYLGVTLLVVAFHASAHAAPRRRAKVPPLADLVERVRQAQSIVVAAERAAAKEQRPSEADLAKRLVEGQVKLEEHDYEGAAITFLDLIENHGESQAAPQAVYFLGEALIPLDMERWAAELFSRNLSDESKEGRRFHQRSVARLLDLTVPRREPGFARQPGLSATPEVRARLASVGADVDLQPPPGVIAEADEERLVRWAGSFDPSAREAPLRYSFGRYLYLRGEHARARDELDGLSPLDIPLSRGGVGARWRIRAAYVAAAATLALGEPDDAIERYVRITRARPRDRGDQQIVELAQMAQGRILHDTGETQDAVRAYRKIGRDSAFFPEAMYETAWTLLRDGQFEQAVQALDLLLIYEPDSPIVPEIKQLRGKVKIQQRDYRGAEEEFLSLRREFDQLGKQLGRKLKMKADATEYFAAVVGEDTEHFSLTAILPPGAVVVARGLPRAVHAESITREVGALERELDDVRQLLARMEEAVGAREKARLFNDLGAHAASLDHMDDDLAAVQDALVDRLGRGVEGAGLRQMSEQKSLLRERLARPTGPSVDRTEGRHDRLEALHESAHKLDLTVAAMRAQLVATERYYEETRKDQQIDHQAFLNQAAELRDDVGALEREVAGVRDRIVRAQASLRYNDPTLTVRQRALAEYRAHLAKMYAAFSKVSPDPEADTLWRRTLVLAERGAKTRDALERAGAARLQAATSVLVEERANLDAYLGELGATKGQTRSLVAEVLAAAYRDVVSELANLVMRSEVGLLDVAWSMKESETEQVHRLEVERDRDLRDIDSSIDVGLEALRQ